LSIPNATHVTQGPHAPWLRAMRVLRRKTDFKVDHRITHVFNRPTAHIIEVVHILQ